MNKLTMFISGILAGIAFTVITLFVILPRQMFLEYESNMDFDQTVEAIITSAKNNNWSMPHQYDLQATMKKNNFEVNPVKVFSICKPEHAYKILSGNDERIASALMPCRISVYEKDGKTYISMLNAGLFSKFMDKKTKNVMGIVSKENKMLLNPVFKN